MIVACLSACALRALKSGTRFIVVPAVCWAACCAHADGQTRQDLAPENKSVFCTNEIEEAIEGQRQHTPLLADRFQSPASRGPRGFRSTPPKTGCGMHPWVRQLQIWNTQGMPLETAMQWLVTGHDGPGSTRLQPQLEGTMEDIARMRAAFTLVSYGHLADARQLWTDLAVRRPHWAEVWFNLGLMAHQQGEAVTAAQHFHRALQTCQRFACAVDSDLLEHWMQKVRVKP